MRFCTERSSSPVSENSLSCRESGGAPDVRRSRVGVVRAVGAKPPAISAAQPLAWCARLWQGLRWPWRRRLRFSTWSHTSRRFSSRGSHLKSTQRPPSS